MFLLTVVRAREIQGKMLILSKTSTSSAADSPKKGRILAAGGTVLKDIDVALDGSNAKVIPFLLRHYTLRLTLYTPNLHIVESMNLSR